ncbi:unnamed protein product [Calicophoron daubneyi]|uniref:Uncharacterized protein n=1 Tax=Calicophoron daubneyi TaxID=300641 RepID=A0AAV2TY84_CALDB
MNCFRNQIFILSFALISLQTATDATDYTVPAAKSVPQTFVLDGSTMNGSTLMLNNNKNLKVHFNFKLNMNNSQTANVTYVLGHETITQHTNFSVVVNQESINFTLTGSWSSGDGGTASYYAANGSTEDDNDRNATNLPVEGVFLISQAKQTPQRIWTCDGCNLTVITRGTTVIYPSKCTTALYFPGMFPVRAETVGLTVTFANNPLTFNVTSYCELGYVVLSYQQGVLPATTTVSTLRTALDKTRYLSCTSHKI